MKTTCRSCGATWYGAKICHCAACHLSFTAAGSFDEHRTGVIHHPDSARDTRRCMTVAELRKRGMEPNEAGQWRHPRPADTFGVPA